MQPAFSVIFLTTLIGAAQGLFLALYGTDISGIGGVAAQDSQRFLFQGSLMALALTALGLLASFFHLGHPERAWRSAAMWRSSWLSREVIAVPLFMLGLCLFGAAQFLGWRNTPLIGAVVVLICLALFVCTAMIYASVRFLQEWASPLTLVNYLLLGTASGLTLSVPIAVLAFPQFAGVLALAAFVIGAAAYVVRCISLLRNARLRPKSTTASAIGIDHPRIAQKAQGFMGGSFNTREFFHGRPDRVVRATRWAFLVLAFPVPAWLLGWGGGSLQVFVAAFVIQFVGLLAERWIFFAEAKHPQNLYYQSMA